MHTLFLLQPVLKFPTLLKLMAGFPYTVKSEYEGSVDSVITLMFAVRTFRGQKDWFQIDRHFCLNIKRP
jgi:hypothetical protein